MSSQIERENTQLERLLLEEFKLTEGKIDKIGEFSFKIRAWAITANSGLVFAVVIKQAHPASLWIGVFATVIFWVLESKQQRISDALSEHAVALEDALAKFSAIGVDPKATVRLASRAALNNLKTIPSLAKACQRRAKNPQHNESWLYAVQMFALLCVWVSIMGENYIKGFLAGAVIVLGYFWKALLNLFSCA